MAFPSFVINFLQGFSLHFYSKILLKMDVFLSKCGHCGGFSAILRRSWQRRLLDHWRIFFLFRCCRKLWTTSFFCFDAIPSVSRRRTRILRSSPSIWWRSTSFLRAVDLFVCLFFSFFFHPQSSFPFPCAVLGRCHGLLAINEKGKEKPKKRKKEITFGALAVRVEVGDGGRRGVFEAEEAGADEALAPGAAHDLHFGILRHVLLQLRLQVLCCRPSSTRSPSKEKKKRTIDRCLATLCSRVKDTFDASPFDRT